MIFFLINFFASWISSGFHGLNYQLDYSFFLSFFDPTCDLQKFKIFVDLLEEGIIIMMILIVATLPCYYKSDKLKWSVFLFISLNLLGIGETQYLNLVLEQKENAINLEFGLFEIAISIWDLCVEHHMWGWITNFCWKWLWGQVWTDAREWRPDLCMHVRTWGSSY
jgi:hypothetical protein